METATNYRYIVKTEGVRGGNARIEGTRIGVHDVVAYFFLVGMWTAFAPRFLI